MGAITFSIDVQLVKLLQARLSLDIFVETGTFEGETIKKVCSLFKVLHTVELSSEYFTRAQNTFVEQSHIHLYHSSSASVIKQLTPTLAEESVLYWLDAHWCVADYSSGDTSQCPLLDELKAIEKLNEQSIIMIDDARYFLCPPPYPHEIAQWPSLGEVLFELQQLSTKHKFVVFNDTLIFYPISVEREINDYVYKNGVDWLQIYYKSTHYDEIFHVAEERLKLIETLDKLCKEKEEVIQTLDKACKEREELIQKQQKIIKIFSQ